MDFEAGTKVGPDQLGPPVRVEWCRLENDSRFLILRQRVVLETNNIIDIWDQLNLILFLRNSNWRPGELPFTWENRKIRLENQIVGAIPFGKKL